MSKTRYIDRQSSGIVICNGPEETFIHEDGESHGTGAQLDAGGKCNQLLQELEDLEKVPNSDQKKADLLRSQIALLWAENDLQIDPNA